MLLLIYGSKGWIGKQFIEVLENLKINYVEGVSRVDDIVTLENEIDTVKPTHILSLIGRTHGHFEGKEYTTIDYLEIKGKLLENVRDNLYSPLMLSLLSKKRNIHFTYLGTGCIFSYDEEHPFGEEVNGFTEDSKPNFYGSSYSVVKGFTDRLLHEFDDSTLNLRIRMPINDKYNSRNFITKITTYKKICSIPNSMTVLPELIPIAIDMLSKNVIGTYNFTNPGLISHNEILEMYKEIIDPYFVWENFSIEEQNTVLASGRSNNFLDTSKIEKSYNVKNIKDSVRECLIKYSK